MTKKRTHRDFNDFLKEKLRDKDLAIAYINEALASGDKKVFLLALKDVIEARGNVTGFAQAANIPRQNIYRILSERGNPTLDNLSSLFNAMELQISVSPKPR
jgi:probable addiction module antidote protein